MRPARLGSSNPSEEPWPSSPGSGRYYDQSPIAAARACPAVLTQLVVAALVVFGLVLIGTSVAAGRLAEREAVNDPAYTANLLAQAVVQPALTEALVAGDQAAYAAFDRIVLAARRSLS